jgi:hypothetical protein
MAETVTSLNGGHIFGLGGERAVLLMAAPATSAAYRSAGGGRGGAALCSTHAGGVRVQWTTRRRSQTIVQFLPHRQCRIVARAAGLSFEEGGAPWYGNRIGEGRSVDKTSTDPAQPPFPGVDQRCGSVSAASRCYRGRSYRYGRSILNLRSAAGMPILFLSRLLALPRLGVQPGVPGWIFPPEEPIKYPAVPMR